MPDETAIIPPDDRLTVASIAVIVYALSSVLHEAVGHGGACVAVGAVPHELSSMHFSCDVAVRGSGSDLLVAAGGTIATLAGGLLALGLFRRSSAASAPAWRYALWLFAAVNLMQGTGYFLFSGVGGIGDWAYVIASLRPQWLWRAGLAIAGGALYMLATRLVFRDIRALTGDASPERYHRARTLATFAYVVGGVFSVAAGALNPRGLGLVLISGAAASFGGTSGLAWGPNYLRGAPAAATPDAPAPVVLGRDPALIVAAAVIAVAFALVLGRGVQFG